MTELSEKLKKRFCVDFNIPITVYKEPYFSERIHLFEVDKQYKDFEFMINNFFQTEGSFLDYYDKTRVKIIDFIKETEIFQELNSMNLSTLYLVDDKFKNIPQKDIYKDNNIGKHFLSIDLIKANYNSLIYFAKINNIPLQKELQSDYKEFIRHFSIYPYLGESKYFRQVIFGNCNSKRLVHIQKYMMSEILSTLIKDCKSKGIVLDLNDIHSFNNDEIIIELSDSLDFSENEIKEVFNIIKNISKDMDIPIKIEQFTLDKVMGSKAFVKKYNEGGIEIKGCPKNDRIFVHKAIHHIPITENDLVFITEDNRLAKLMEVPEYTFIRTKEDSLDTNLDEVELD